MAPLLRMMRLPLHRLIRILLKTPIATTMHEKQPHGRLSIHGDQDRHEQPVRVFNMVKLTRVEWGLGRRRKKGVKGSGIEQPWS